MVVVVVAVVAAVVAVLVVVVLKRYPLLQRLGDRVLDMVAEVCGQRLGSGGMGNPIHDGPQLLKKHREFPRDNYIHIYIYMYMYIKY